SFDHAWPRCSVQLEHYVGALFKYRAWNFDISIWLPSHTTQLDQREQTTSTVVDSSLCMDGFFSRPVGELALGFANTVVFKYPLGPDYNMGHHRLAVDLACLVRHLGCRRKRHDSFILPCKWYVDMDSRRTPPACLKRTQAAFLNICCL